MFWVIRSPLSKFSKYSVMWYIAFAVEVNLGGHGQRPAVGSIIKDQTTGWTVWRKTWLNSFKRCVKLRTFKIVLSKANSGWNREVGSDFLFHSFLQGCHVGEDSDIALPRYPRYPRGISSRDHPPPTPQIWKFVDAEVPYIKWHSVCKWPMHILLYILLLLF